MAKKKKGGKRRMSVGEIADKIANVNAALQLGAPIVENALGPALSGDLPGALAGARQGAREALSGKNLIEAFGPKLAVKATRKGMAMLNKL